MFKIRKEQKEAFAAAFGKMAEPCSTCLIVRIVEIKGLYMGGYDDRLDAKKRPKPPDDETTKGASYVEGYASLDDKGRIFINRDADGNWKRDTQGIDITVRVDPPSVPIPPGTVIEWSFEDPDDPSNEDPRMHRDAARFLDPNDYVGNKKTGANAGDNDPYHKATAKPGFAELEPRYPLSGNKTPVDPVTRLSKVRFNASNIAGDNYRVRADITPKAPVTTTVSATTGLVTVWNRIDVEYVRMASADELPLKELPLHFDIAFAQIDISLRRVASDWYDMPFMGRDKSAADWMCEIYATRSPGQFTMEGKPGWFFIVAANRYRPEKHHQVIYEGDAFAHKHAIRLPKGTVLRDTPVTARVFNSQKVQNLVKPWPSNRDWFTAFDTTVYEDREHKVTWLMLTPHDFYQVDDPDKPFLLANLGDYGFGVGAPISIQLLNEGQETSSGYANGISPGGIEIGGHTYFGGKVIVFTKVLQADKRIQTLCHELCHAFDNAHKCGNWDWTNGPTRHACAMTYARMFVLDQAAPRRPIRWTQNRRSADFCAAHLGRMRNYHLQDNPGLGWK